MTQWELASVQEGDIILSCDDTKLDEGVSLLEMIRACQPDDKVVLEISSDGQRRKVEWCPNCGTPACICDPSTPEDE